MFAHIECLDDLVERIKDKPEIRVMEQPNGTTVVCYMISNEDTFNGEHAAFARECRGITFDRNGKILVRPLHKFFNVNEREETLDYHLPWNTVARVMDKRDGSMITPVVIDGALVCKSKKSFESDVAVASTELLSLPENSKIANFARHICNLNKTAIFEFTSPHHRIVLPYESRKLTLLNVRDNITGAYEHNYVKLAIDEGIPVVDFITEFGEEETFNHTHIKDALTTRENVEGWVIQFADGNMVKWKTAWYMALHHIVVFQTERAVAEMVLDENIDDMKSAMTSVGANMDKVHEIEHRVVSELNFLREKVEKLVSEYAHLERKEFAIATRSNDLFSLMIRHYIGQEPDYVGHFKKYILKENYTLEQI